MYPTVKSEFSHVLYFRSLLPPPRPEEFLYTSTISNVSNQSKSKSLSKFSYLDYSKPKISNLYQQKYSKCFHYAKSNKKVTFVEFLPVMIFFTA